MGTLRRAAAMTAVVTLFAIGIIGSPAAAGTPSGSGSLDPDVFVMEAAWVNADGTVDCNGTLFGSDAQCSHPGDSAISGSPGVGFQPCREVAAGTGPPVGACFADLTASSSGSIFEGFDSALCETFGSGTLTYTSATLGTIFIPVTVAHRWRGAPTSQGEGGGPASHASVADLHGETTVTIAGQTLDVVFDGTIVWEDPVPSFNRPCRQPVRDGEFSGVIQVIFDPLAS